MEENLYFVEVLILIYSEKKSTASNGSPTILNLKARNKTLFK